MRSKWILGGLGALVLVSQLPAVIGAQDQGVKADYDRANALANKVNNKIYDVVSAPTWIDGSAKFWYRRSVKGGNDFVLVDPAVPSKGPAFDHAKLADGLTKAVPGRTFTAVTLPFATFTYVDDQKAIQFALGANGGGRGARAGGAPPPAGATASAPPTYKCTLTDYVCTQQAAGTTTAPGQGRGARGAAGAAAAAGVGRGGATADQPQVRISPDQKSEAFIDNFNIYIRPAGGRPQDGKPLSWDGSEGNYYTFNSIQWSPDSTKIAAYRRHPGYQRMVSYVQSSPPDQLQPKSSSRYYQKPGDVVDLDQPVLFNVATKQQINVDNALFLNPYENSRQLRWRRDGHAFTFEYNQRGHQAYRVIEVNAETGKARAVIDEESKTFIRYAMVTPTSASSDIGRQYRYDVADGKEIIWMSERDGWAHLYLYDGVTGQVKNQITKGNWVVHTVDRVDEQNRQIWFTANGMDDGKDPYLVNYFRINFDGTGLTRFTKDDGMHQVTWSPNHDYYVDSYSRVDLPPVSELRRTSDQSLVLDLEKADISDLLATGWKAPEVFSAKGRDGTTDIWGVIIRPTNFDPSKKYPVIENIYAGPQGSFVPKTFSTQTGMQAMAELGFIVVEIDGMGTSNRSKAFHDVAWKDLGDAGFPDRILWHKAVAAKYPYYDITRVGIYGTSAGGQNAMGAVLFHPEFYKAAAAASGCHDNRMDKIWWNELWMGWPVGPEYAASSNMENASKLQGALLLIYGEMDTNVDPSSTMQVVNKLILANKEFDLLAIPNSDHTSGGAYGDHKRFDFFVHHLRGLEPLSWNAMPATTMSTPSVLDEDAMVWIASEDAWGQPENR